MAVTYHTLPITGRKTSDLSLVSSLPLNAQIMFWSGIANQTLQRVASPALIDSLLKHTRVEVADMPTDRTLTATDQYFQMFRTAGVARTVTLAAQMSYLIHLIPESTHKLTVKGAGGRMLVLSPGETCFAIHSLTVGRNQEFIKLGVSNGGGGGGGGGTDFLTISVTDLTDPTHYYYGGLDKDFQWKINRFDRSNLSNKSSATDADNPGHSLATAWNDHTTLIYV